MKVTIIGADNMGRGIGTRALDGEHDVEIADRDPEQARALAKELGGSATAVGPDNPVRGDVVVFAVYYPGIKDAVREYFGSLRRARQLEQLGFLHIAVQQPLGFGFGSAIKVHS